MEQMFQKSTAVDLGYLKGELSKMLTVEAAASLTTCKLLELAPDPVGEPG